jgi:ABC-type nitrate/sulfonate/bicarbonate transport system substrate-binding protein
MNNEFQMTRRQTFGIAALPIAMSAGSAMPAFAQQSGGKLQIRVVNTSGDSTFVFQELLKNQGILDSFGVEPTFTNLADGSKITAALLNNESDVCMQAGFGPLLAEIDKGSPLKVIAGGSLLSPQTIYSSKADVQEVKDLIGRSVGVGTLGAALHQKMVALLRKRGLDDTKVKFVNTGSTGDTFKAAVAGTVDAGLADINMYADQAKYGVHSLKDGNFWTELPEYTNQAAYATTATIAAKREAIVRMIAAYAKLYRFLQSPESKNAYMTTSAQITKTPVSDKIDPQWQFYQDAKPYPTKIALTPERIRYIQELNVAMGLQKDILPFEKCADMSLADDALKLLDKA